MGIYTIKKGVSNGDLRDPDQVSLLEGLWAKPDQARRQPWLNVVRSAGRPPRDMGVKAASQETDETGWLRR